MERANPVVHQWAMLLLCGMGMTRTMVGAVACRLSDVSVSCFLWWAGHQQKPMMLQRGHDGGGVGSDIWSGSYNRQTSYCNVDNCMDSASCM